MKAVHDIVFIIHARLTEEKIPGKVLKPFAGSTLFEILIRKLLKSDLIPTENIYASVYDYKLVEVSRKYHLNVFSRSVGSCSEDHDVKTVFNWSEDLDFPYYVRVNPCAPFLSLATIEDFISVFCKSDYRGMFGVVGHSNYVWNNNFQLLNPWPETECLVANRASTFYEAAHCLYAGHVDDLRRGIDMGSFRSRDDPHLYSISERESFYIREPWQFSMAEKDFQE